MTAKLVKHFTRDLSLFQNQWWREALIRTFKPSLGAGYTDYIAASDGVSVTFFYLEEEGRAIKAAFLSRLSEHAEYYTEERQQFRKDTSDTKSILQRLQGKSLDSESLSTLKKRLSLLYPVMRLSLLIPSDWEPDVRRVLGANAQATISAAFDDRVFSEGVFEAIDSLVRRWLESDFWRYGRLGNFSKFVSAEEALSLAGGEDVDWAKIERRSRGYVFCNGNLYETRELPAVLAENGYEYSEDSTDAKFASGTVAFNGGIVSGRARLVFAAEQLPAFKEGEILVSPMTVPDFVPAMRKAAAIVTDEGGITCHAAIVARELGKPCVIGTKHATKVFRDGDLVEVDSEKGVVRKMG